MPLADLKIIDTDVGRLCCHCLLQGVLPNILSQVGQARDKVQAPILDACCMHVINGCINLQHCVGCAAQNGRIKVDSAGQPQRVSRTECASRVRH